MTQIPTDVRKARILGIIAQGFTIKKDIQLTVKERLGLSESTIQRLMKGYLDDGSLQLKARDYSVTREGQKWLSKRQGTPEMLFRDSKLRGIIDKLPTPQHRAFVYFILSAITAKLYLWEKRDKFYPSFIIGGLTADIKTLLAEIVCDSLKLSQADHIQDVIRKTEAQVLGTFDKIVNGKRTLDPAPYYSYPFICWDDLDKLSNKAVWKALMSYIDGYAYREERGTYIERRQTCLVTMNFKTANLQIDEPYIRRCFVIDSKGLYCDPKQNEVIGSEIGDALKDLPKLKIDNLTVSFKKLGKADKDFLRDLLYRWLKSKDDGRVVDTSFLEKIVLGWLILNQTGDVRDAIYWAVEGALLFLQTQDRVKEGWRNELTTEWGNYQSGVNPDFKEEWERHLEQVTKDDKAVEDYKKGKEEVVIDEDAIERATLAKYTPMLDSLKKIKTSFVEMNGDKQHLSLLYLSMDLKKFTSYLPTEKRENRVTKDILRGLEIVLNEWEEQYKPIREAWEEEQRRERKAKETLEGILRWLTDEKTRLRRWRHKDKNGVLWTERVKPTIAKIGNVLDPKTQKKFYNNTYLTEIQSDIKALDAEVKEFNEMLEQKKKQGVTIPQLPFDLEDLEEGSEEFIGATIESVGQPSPRRKIKMWQLLLMKLDQKLKGKGKGRSKTESIDEQIDRDIREGRGGAGGL